MRNYFYLFGISLFGCTLSALPTAVAAKEFATDEVITLRQAVEYTIEASPFLAISGFQVEARAGEVLQAGTGPRPELNVELENVMGSGPYSGTDEAELTLSLSWMLERGKRDGRERSAEAALSLAEADVEIARLNAAAETARLYLDCVENQELVSLLDASVAYEEDGLKAIRTRVDKGRSPAADLAQAEARLARQRLAREGYASSFDSAMRRLAAQWGSRELQASVQRLALSVPEIRDFASLQEQLIASPHITRYLNEQRFHEAEFELTKLRNKSSWTIDAGLRRFEASKDNAVVAGISVPLGVASANEGAVAAARAGIASSKAGLRARQLEMETRLYGVYQDYVYSLRMLDVLQDNVMPSVQFALVETRKAYAAGRYSYVSLRDAQDELLEVRKAVLLATLDANRALIEIERLTGAVVRAVRAREEVR